MLPCLIVSDFVETTELSLSFAWNVRSVAVLPAEEPTLMQLVCLLLLPDLA
jgi:hypothetical protein